MRFPFPPSPSDSALLSRRLSFSTAGKSQVIKKTWMQESTIGLLDGGIPFKDIAPKANIFLPCDAENVNASRGFCAVERGIDL